MILYLYIVCIIIAIIVGHFVKKKETYNRLDKLGVIFNIVLTVHYIPMSLFGLFSCFAADNIDRYSKFIQIIIDAMIIIGVALPILSVLCISASIILRKIDKGILSFIIQFVPLLLFIIMVVIFEVVSNISV